MDRLGYDVADAAADLPGATLDPRNLFVDFPVKQTFQITEGAKRQFNRNRHDHGIVSPRQHGPHSKRVGGLCADSERKTRAQIGLLQIEQFELKVESATVAAERAVGGDHTMTGNNNRDGIAVVRHADGAECMRMRDGLGDVAVGASLAVRDVEQGAPALQLKIGAAEVQWEGEVLAITVEIFVEFAEPGSEGFGGLLPGLIVAFGGLATVELEFEQAAGGESEDQGAYGGSGAGEVDGFHGVVIKDSAIMRPGLKSWPQRFFRPFGAEYSRHLPTACAVGFNLAPLRGCFTPNVEETKKASCFHGRLVRLGGERFYFGGCCWSVGVAAGAVDDEANCSRLFFRRLISTRPPEIRLGLVVVSPAVACTGALPMPTR